MSDDITWPGDADGDVLRNLRKGGFDFSKDYAIDFNVDFESWPPPENAILEIERAYPAALVARQEEDRYVLVKVTSKVSYEVVVESQRLLSGIAAAYGGYCESWGVGH